jgi:anaerobic selenocysteine-containing dehydrogenase
MSASVKTHDHKKIQRWAEERGGVPAKIKATGKDEESGVLRIHFPKRSKDDEQFEEISWDDFFDNFDENKLDFLYQDEKADGETSTFHKFVERE